MKKVGFVFVMALLVSFYANAQDWPQFLGPYRNGVSDQKGIIRSFPSGGLEVLWSAPLGIGYGGPVIKEGKVYILDRDDEYGDIMKCFDLNSGTELWRYGYEAPGSVMFPGSRSVPIVDGNFVYSCGPYGDLYCIDINSHQPVWNKNVWKDYGGENIPTWAISQCPMVYGNLLIIASQAPEAGVVAYNKVTGAEVWKTPCLGEVGYVSPTLVKISGEDHIAYVTASGRGAGQGGKVVGIQPLTGKILWEFDEWDCHIPVAPATDAGDNKLLIVGGYELGALMIQVVKNSDGSFSAKELYRTVEFGDQTKPPLLIDGYFYAQYGTNSRRDGLACMSMGGEVMWKTKRDPDFNKGSMIYADGLIIATDGAKSLFLVEPDPTGFKPLASSEILTAAEPGEGMMANFGTQNWGPLALSNGKLLIRDQEKMLCIKITQ